jgi:hypothetical protein
VLLWHAQAAHRGVAFWYFMLAAICLCGPPSWFGPTWSYFQHIPHGGFGLGITNLVLGFATTYALWRRKRRLMIWCLGVGATALWIAAVLIFAQGVIGGMGLMESWFMMYVAVDIGLRSVTLAVATR